MSATRSGPRELARAVGGDARRLAGMLRRMIVTRTSSAIASGAAAVWQVAGHLLPSGDRETRDAELYQGIGIAARPNADDDTEAIVAFPQGAAGPIIIATRQEARRRVVAADLEAGETQIHNSSSEHATIIRIKRDGTVEIRSHGGTAAPLARLSELQALADLFFGHVHTATSIGSPTTTPQEATGDPIEPASYDGTSILKAE